MSNLQVQEINVNDNSVTFRNMTEQELAQCNKDIEDELATKASKQAQAEAKAAEKAALLQRLGITEAEAQLLLS